MLYKSAPETFILTIPVGDKPFYGVNFGNSSLEKFLSFGFPGVVDITNMFEFFSTGK